MPISNYFNGGGSKVMENMSREYGPEKGKRIFYATANKRGVTAPKPPSAPSIAKVKGPSLTKSVSGAISIKSPRISMPRIKSGL